MNLLIAPLWAGGKSGWGGKLREINRKHEEIMMTRERKYRTSVLPPPPPPPPRKLRGGMEGMLLHSCRLILSFYIENIMVFGLKSIEYGLREIGFSFVNTRHGSDTGKLLKNRNSTICWKDVTIHSLRRWTPGSDSLAEKYLILLIILSSFIFVFLTYNSFYLLFQFLFVFFS